MEVTFRKHTNEVNPGSGPQTDKPAEVEVCEIKYDDGRVAAFPANEKDVSKSNELGRDVTFAQAYPNEYGHFKTAGPNDARIQVLTAEIKERQDELDSLKPKKAEKPAKAEPEHHKRAAR